MERVRDEHFEHGNSKLVKSALKAAWHSTGGQSLYLSNAQVPYDRILNAADEPQNWLTYNGSYMSQRYSLLDQIKQDNVGDLELKWVLQNQVFGAWQSNPIVVDGIMYVTERPNSVMAVDAITGRVFWKYAHTPDERARCVAVRIIGGSRFSVIGCLWVPLMLG